MRQQIHHFAPLVFFDGPPAHGVTWFNKFPMTAATRAMDLFKFAATPFNLFRFWPFGNIPHVSMAPIDIVFDSRDLLSHPRLPHRPVLIWSSNSRMPEFLSVLDKTRPMFVVLVTEDQSLAESCADLDLNSPVRTVLQTNARTNEGHVFDLSEIFSAYLECIHAAAKKMQMAGLPFSTFPRFSEPERLATLIDLSRQGSLSRWSPALPDIEVPDDYVASPNRILANALLMKIPKLCEGAFEKNASISDSVQLAKLALGLRGIENYLTNVGGVFAYSDLDANFISRLSAEYQQLLEHAANFVLELDGEDHETIEQLVGDECILEMRAFAPHQFILICPSISLGLVERLESEGFIPKRGAFADTVARERQFFEKFAEVLSGPGRYMNYIEPENGDQANILRAGMEMRRAESSLVTSFGILHASRFACPIMKAPNVGGELQKTIEQADNAAANLWASESPSGSRDLQRSLSVLSQQMTQAVPREYLEFLEDRPVDPLKGHEYSMGSGFTLVHSFSDHPLEFVHDSGDWLGYRAALSRTPITPGNVMMRNFSQTELEIEWPRRIEDIIIATPFEAGTEFHDPEISAFLQVNQLANMLQKQIVRTRSDLLTALSNPSNKCLIYFGHAIYDQAHRYSALELQGGPLSGRGPHRCFANTSCNSHDWLQHCRRGWNNRDSAFRSADVGSHTDDRLRLPRPKNYRSFVPGYFSSVTA